MRVILLLLLLSYILRYYYYYAGKYFPSIRRTSGTSIRVDFVNANRSATMYAFFLYTDSETQTIG